MADFSAIKARPEAIRQTGFAAIAATGNPVAIGGTLTYPARIVLIQNLTDALLTFAWDSVSFLELPSGGFFTIDLTSNKNTNAETLCVSAGTQFYVIRNGVPTSGTVNVTVIYGANS